MTEVLLFYYGDIHRTGTKKPRTFVERRESMRFRSLSSHGLLIVLVIGLVVVFEVYMIFTGLFDKYAARFISSPIIEALAAVIILHYFRASRGGRISIFEDAGVFVVVLLLGLFLKALVSLS